MASPTSRRRTTTWVAGTATLLALLALLISSVTSIPSALAKRIPNVPGSGALSSRDPRTPAQKRYEAWLAQQQAKFKTPAQIRAMRANTAKLPDWRANAHEVINSAHALPHSAIAPHVAVPVTTDPSNWTALGPAPISLDGNTFSGGITAISSSASNANDLWIATSESGVWHSTDGGATWSTTTDHLPTLSFNAIAVDPSNDSVIYAGSGNPLGYFNYLGEGIFKSTDNGASWTQEQGTAFEGDDVLKIAIDPSNTQTILAAVGGVSGYYPSEFGVWRSTDGGANWSQVLYDSTNSTYTNANATDIVFDPANSAVIYAALGNIAGPQSTTSPQGIYKSTDHGATWTLLTGTNAPTGQNVGRVSLGISHNGVYLYASIADSGFSNSGYGALLNSSIYEYNTGSNTWTTISLVGSTLDTQGELSQGWTFNNVIAVDPTDSTGATIYLGASGLYRSTNSGATWTQQGGVSGFGYDQYSLYFPSASSSAYYISGFQGIWHVSSGVFTSKNATLNISDVVGGSYGDSGSHSPLYATMSRPLYGAIQYPASSTGQAGWTNLDNSFGGVSVDWSNNANVYMTSLACSDLSCTTFTTYVDKSTDGGSTFNHTGLATTDAGGFGATPVISPQHPQSLYFGTTRLWATTNGGTTWNTISPQLDTTPQFGGTCTGPSDTGCPFITQVVVAPSNDNEILVAYGDGQAFATTNGGASWYGVQSLCNGEAGCQSNSAQYAISPANALTIYVVGSAFATSTSTFFSGVFVSTNGGHGWSLLSNSSSLPTSTAPGIAISPTNPHLIVIATYLGAFISTNDGVDWASVSGLPNVETMNVFFSHDGSQMLITTWGRGVWAIAMPHLASQTQAVTLTTTPGSSPADQNVTLQNTGQGALSWSTSGLPAWLHVSPPSGSIPAGGSANVTLSFDTTSMTPQTYATMLTFTGNADNANVALPVTVSSSLSKTWYFAEGYTGGSFTEYLTLANPNPVAANVSVQYLLQGQSPVTKNYTVSANARKTVNVNTELGQGIGVSMVVTSDVPIVAERPMYFTFTGAGLNVPGGTDVLGATSLGTQFDFGYLDTTANHATYLTVLNPSGSSMDVTVNYYAAAGGSPTTVMHSVPANSRGTILVNDDVPAGSYSALVTLSTNGLVERPMYLTDATTGYTGSADVIGVQQPTTSWSFAEGYTSPTFAERYILSNPGNSTAHATVTFLKSDGTTDSATVNLNPGQQQVVDANSVLGNGVNNSAQVTSDQPILAERFMSFTYTGPVGVSGSGNIPGATDVLGAPTTGTVYAFAEGYTGGAFAEYLTLENPNATTTQVTVVYLPQNGGSPTIQTYFVAPTSRYTILTNRVMVNQSFSMLVLASAPIVAERPMYFNYTGGQTGGSDVLGYQP